MYLLKDDFTRIILHIPKGYETHEHCHGGIKTVQNIDSYVLSKTGSFIFSARKLYHFINWLNFFKVNSVADPEEVQGVRLTPSPRPVFKYPMKMK